MELTRGTIRRLARSSVDGIDPMLLTLALMLTALGIATLYSASHESPGRVVSQLRHLAVALCAMWLVARLPIQLLMRSALPVYLAGMLLLVCVALFGDVVNGARRWLNVGVMRFQPSEMMKIAVPLMLAWYFHRNEGNLRRRGVRRRGAAGGCARRCSSRASPTSAPRCSSPPPGSTSSSSPA